MFKPKFTITPQINSQIAEIEKLRTIMDQSVIFPELEIQLRFRATISAVHSSTSIEGNPLSKNQVEKIISGKVITAPEYAIREVLNYKKAIDWLLKRKPDFKPNAESILRIHKILMDGLLLSEKVGKWRPGPIYIVDEIDKKEVLQYTGPRAKDLDKLVESLLSWIDHKENNSLHPVLKAGLLHYLFVSIHPFSDGNGRTTRLLTSSFLKSWKYDFKDSLSLDSYYLQNRTKYFEALSLGSTFDERVDADLTPFLEFFIKGFLTVAQELSQYFITGKVRTDGTEPIRLSKDEMLILDYVRQFKSISLKDVNSVLSVSERTAQRRLAGLVNKNILKMIGEGPATEYLLVKS